jgi:predicted homoserine dehydrogenase-like protein
MAENSRRDFIKQAALGTAAYLAYPAAKVLGANDRIRVGMIGVGGRGQALLEEVQKVPNVQLVAMADIYSRRREEAK